MSVISLKCPNCGGELLFEPGLQGYQCPYCDSKFTQEQLEEREKQLSPEEEMTAFVASNQESGGKEAANAEQMVTYSCPSCGAEIVTDETTAATFCYYCHNPVTLTGRLSGKYLPSRIIPFRIDREKAEEMLKQEMRRKLFVPKGFFESRQIQKLSGVYFPFWSVDWEGIGRLQTTARNVRIYRRGDTEYTETKTYQIERKGRIQIPDITKTALHKANRVLVEGVQPFEQKDAKPFSAGYLSGFFAEKRDMEKEEFFDKVHAEIEQYANSLLQDSVKGYTSVMPGNTELHTNKEEWEYLLVPVWLLTYRSQKGKIFYYAINGQTGKVCGEFPVDFMKLGAVSAIVSMLVLLVGLLVGFII